MLDLAKEEEEMQEEESLRLGSAGTRNEENSFGSRADCDAESYFEELQQDEAEEEMLK